MSAACIATCDWVVDGNARFLVLMSFWECGNIKKKKIGEVFYDAIES